MRVTDFLENQDADLLQKIGQTLSWAERSYKIENGRIAKTAVSLFKKILQIAWAILFPLGLLLGMLLVYCSKSHKYFSWIVAGGSKEKRFEAQERLRACQEDKSPTLDLSELGLTELPPGLERLTFLKTIDLSFNQLTVFPASLSKTLERFYLHNNLIETLPECEFRKLKTLSLYNNRLREIPELFFRGFNRRTVINMEGNPFPDGYDEEIQQRLESRRLTGESMPHIHLIPNSPSPRKTQVTLTERITDPGLAPFLEGLMMTRDYKAGSDDDQEVIAQRVLSIYRHMQENKAFDRVVRLQVEESLTNCGDKPLLRLNNLETLWQIHKGQQTPLELAVLAIGLTRLDWIRIHSPDNELYLHRTLAKVLKLPIETKHYDPVDLTSPQNIARRIKVATSSKEAVVKALLERDFWRKYLWTAHEDHYNRMSEGVMSRKDLNDEEQQKLVKELIEKDFMIHTVAWYDSNSKELMAYLE